MKEKRFERHFENISGVVRFGFIDYIKVTLLDLTLLMECSIFNLFLEYVETVETLIRCRKMQHLMRVPTV